MQTAVCVLFHMASQISFRWKKILKCLCPFTFSFYFGENFFIVDFYLFFIKMLDNQESADVDTQEHSFTRTIDEEAEMEEQAERDREEGHIEQEDEEEEREHEVMTAGSKYLWGSVV